jgi:hypothetical protein
MDVSSLEPAIEVAVAEARSPTLQQRGRPLSTAGQCAVADLPLAAPSTLGGGARELPRRGAPRAEQELVPL